jgi:rare lipoprotein A
MVIRKVLSFSARGILTCAVVCLAAQAQPNEEGLASWYGDSFSGQRSASGEVFHQEDLTAAHRTLPFGTTVRIRRVDTGASVIVRINDRGPFIESRIVDLSNAAARKLDMLQPGVVPVALEVLSSAPADPHIQFAVQAGTFRLLANAERTRSLLAKLYGAARIVPRGASALWCVLVGAEPTHSAAETLASAVRKSADGLQSAFVIKLPTQPAVSD